MSREIELKLAIDPCDVSTLRESSILRELTLQHSPRRSLLSVYYDTPCNSLARRGIMLRVRKIGSKRVQCVKMNAATTSVFQRTEFESPIRGNRPDLTQIADPDVRRAVQKRCARHELARVFATNVVREAWLLRLGRSQIECAIDRGVIESEGKKTPISEVELELKSGQPARIYELAHRLNAIVPLRIETKSKEARGYDLVEHAKLAVPKAGPILVTAPMSAGECLAAIAQPCVAHILASANFAYKSNDPEGIHQLRVAIRRMRAAFSIFHSAMAENCRPRLAAELQTFGQTLGAARDWDVLVEETIASMPIRLRRQRSTTRLIRVARAKRAEGDKSAQASLRDPQYTEILLQLASWADSQFGPNGSLQQEGKWKPDVLAGPAPGFAAQVMQTFHDKARKLGRKVRELDPPGIHRLRIRIKKLRCATDFFGGFWPNRRTERYLAALKGLQEALGVFHDTTIADELLIAHLTAAEGADVKLSTAPVNRWLTKHQRGLRKKVIKLWGKFANQKPFWDVA
jgi:inorganic triphosphatase YgiF